MLSSQESTQIMMKKKKKIKRWYFVENFILQVVIVGNGGVGKSSMIQRYCKGIYTKDYKKTIGVDFLERQIE